MSTNEVLLVNAWWNMRGKRLTTIEALDRAMPEASSQDSFRDYLYWWYATREEQSKEIVGPFLAACVRVEASGHSMSFLRNLKSDFATWVPTNETVVLDRDSFMEALNFDPGVTNGGFGKGGSTELPKPSE